MRQLSMVELELIVGGYDSGGGGGGADPGDYNYGASSMSIGTGDDVTATIDGGDVQGIAQEFALADIVIPPVTIPVDLGSGIKVSITTPKITISKHKH